MYRNIMSIQRLLEIDLEILQRLQKNARITNVELASKVGLSPSACLRRVKSLERQDYIRGYVAMLNPAKFGLGANVFLQVSLEKKDEAHLQAFEEAVASRSEVLECYLMTGDSDYLLRVAVPDVEAFQQFLMDHLTKIEGIASIRSSFSLKQVKYTTCLPLDNLNL